MIKWLWILLIPFVGFSQDDNAFAKAESLIKNKQYQRAKPYLLQYHKEHPSNVKAIEYLGDIEGNAKNWDAAIPYYKKLVRTYPKNANYHYKYGGVLGMKALEVNKFSALSLIGDIKESFETAATLDPNHTEARWALVELYMQLPSLIGGSENKAQAYADQLLSISKVDGYLAHGYIAEYSDRPKQAENYFKQALEVGGSLTCYEKVSDLYEKNGSIEKAQQTIKKAQEKHSTSNRLHYQFGKIAGKYGVGLEEGITCLHKYISNHSAQDGVPKDWAYLRLAQIYKHKGNKTEALQWINKALKSRSDFKEALAEKKRILAI